VFEGGTEVAGEFGSLLCGVEPRVPACNRPPLFFAVLDIAVADTGEGVSASPRFLAVPLPVGLSSSL
jgi:hypothetical protein